MAGWIKISKDINKHWIWEDPVKLQWWIDILLTVNYEDKKVPIGFKLFECKRGESLMSLQSWATRWKVNKSSVDRFFKLLENENMIERKSETVTIRIKVCNYDSYQQSENGSETQQKRKRNANETQSDTTKEYKEEKNIRNKEYKNILLSEIKISDDILFKKIYFETAVGFRDLIRQNLIELNASIKNIDSTKGSAIDEIRLIIESDGFTIEDCRQVYKFLQKDIFWKKNILSIKKLREKFNKLLIEAKNGDSKIQSGNSSYRKNTAGANAEDKKRSVDRLADMAETILQNLAPCNIQ